MDELPVDELRSRVIACFQTVFPDLSEAEVLAADQETLGAWDSAAAIMLLNVVEEEFQIEIDLDVLADLNSFERVCEHLRTRIGAA